MRPDHALARAAAIAASLAAATTHAAISVTPTPASGPSFTLTPVGSKTRITLNTSVTTEPTSFLIRGDATDQIENIILNANPSFQTTFLTVRGPTAGTTLASVDSINMMSSTSTCILLDVRTTGNVGPIRMNTIADMHVGGDITGPITLIQRAGGGESSLIAGTVTGKIRGNILIDYGAIYALTATEGIGTSAIPVQLRTKLNIERITAKEIFADITTFANGGTGFTGTIETLNGPFTGSLITRRIASPGAGKYAALTINGDLDANITITENIANENNSNPAVNVAGRLMLARTFRVGTSLDPGATFRIGTPGGLQGQLIINDQNNGGTWSGPVTISATTLGPVPMYSSPSAPIGGGSAGHVPFHLHAADAWPPPSSVISPAAAPRPNAPIRLRWYGPVNWTPGQTPLVIEANPLASPGLWINQTACFNIAREPGLNPHPNVVAAYPITALPPGYTYRARPVTLGPGALLCDLGLAVNPSVADDSSLYSFTISGGCTGDADGNGIVNFADISTILSNWSASPGACLSTTDVNRDGAVNFADITTTLAGFGAACP
ncbi:MAG: hypothetical protein JNK58_08860 [Phycisphaerae bacterium]|nr:hypothetical protein [Phycisphaerae bacterium]